MQLENRAREKYNLTPHVVEQEPGYFPNLIYGKYILDCRHQCLRCFSTYFGTSAPLNYLSKSEALNFSCSRLGQFVDKFDPAWVLVIRDAVSYKMLNV